VQKRLNLVSQSTLNRKNNSKNQDIQPGSITADLIKDIIRMNNEIKDQLIVIKLSSVIIENDTLLVNFAENIKLLNSCGAKICIIHDHTNLVSDTLKLLGFDEKLINSIKVSDYRSTQIIEMVVSGHINKLIVSTFCKIGCNAIGISGKDGNLIEAKKAKLIYNKVMDDAIIDVGFISEPVVVNPDILLHFEDDDIIPIISPIASDKNGITHLLDVDLTASIISSALDAHHLILPCSEQLLDTDELKFKDIKTLQKMLVQNSFSAEMHSLIRAAINAIENNTANVHFVNPTLLDSMLISIFTN
jgi:acetylglutamate kinase